MGRVFRVTLEGKIYSCKHCRTHLALCDDIVSKTFQCKHGKAYLFSKVFLRVGTVKSCDLPVMLYFLVFVENHHMFYSVNVTVGAKEDRLMMTGLHTVADIFCVKCGSIVGWTYETAHDKNQKYKEGKSVLERLKLSGPEGSNYWVSHEAHIGGSDQDD
ncbi:Yippee-like protein [Cynara cardunculus var. scolymus]|uniref:Protein yippee-like n=1 Tax=Cynara cardunculus var. scolymus TaxID=59895 RepID=A0A103YJ44_CYNCS|nr:Yippee-like protein [Cynara cardunculus var. scolymus]